MKARLVQQLQVHQSLYHCKLNLGFELLGNGKQQKAIAFWVILSDQSYICIKVFIWSQSKSADTSMI